MPRPILLIMLVFSLLFVAQDGCTSRREITRYSQLTNPLETGEIFVITKDGVRFTLNNYRATDSLLIGSGEVDTGRTGLFSGEIPFASIAAIQTSHRNVLKTLIAVGIVGFGMSTLGNDFSMQEKTTYHGPVGSCPYVYSFDGTRFRLEAETFAGAVFRGAEHVSYDVLRYLAPVEGRYVLKLTNERPETEHTNELRLLELHHPVGVAVLPDMTGGFHSISDPVRPIRCNDYTGRDALEQILEDDNLFWESDLPSKDLAKEDNLRDGLMMEFPKPLGAKVAKFVVRGMNTALGSFALQQLFSLKGVNRLDWYRRLEENTGESLRLLGFMKREGMLHVKVKRDNEWVEQAAFFDPGPVVSKEQLVVLDVSEISGDRIHIALECATDLWRIDQVFADYSTDIPVYPEELPLVSALDESGRDVGDLLKRDDDKYYTTIQGEIAQLAFAVPPSQPGSQSTFVLKTKGFYHEWFTQSGKDQTALLEKILEDPLLGAKLYMAKWREVKPEYQ